ncbi:MAG: hypothetical protein POELPBGB_00799 [Bacteroidia bacterium]|nr:hypothetical protein [Bacteroidia bacterium]
MKAKPLANYVIHLNNVAIKILNEPSLRAIDISIYYALFHYWNLARFKNPISIARHEIMKLAKVGATASYSKSLWRLTDLGFISYLPSNNPIKGSQVFVIPLDKVSIVENKLSSGDELSNEMVVAPSKTIETSIKTSETYERGDALSITNSNNLLVDGKENVAEKRKNVVGDFEIPSETEIKSFFTENKSTNSEGQLFFLHYQSNGWMIGKTRMNNWKASALKWILTTPSKETKVNLNLENNRSKDYDKPF